MKIKNAIIIHGPGRSGTTLLNNILSLHSDLGWVSNIVNKYPNILSLTLLNRLQDITSFEKFSKGRRWFPRPTEAYNFWLHYYPNFNNDNYELNYSHIERTKRAVRQIVKVSGKKRFIFKITGESRSKTIGLLFDNPCIIWIDRNPKAVIMSYYKQRWWYKNNILDFEKKSTFELLDEYSLKYKLFQNLKEELNKFNLNTVLYEDFIKDRHQFLKNVCEFCDLSFNSDFQKIIDGWDIYTGTNTAFSKHLTVEQNTYLSNLVEDL